MAFSVMTMAWSTKMPIEIVMPANDMMLAWMSIMPSDAAATSEETRTAPPAASVTQMTNTLRTCNKMRRMATQAMIISCHITSVSVWIAPVMSRVRS